MRKKNKRVTRELFSIVMKNGASYHSPHFSFRVAENGTKGYHSATVVSKKIALRAIIRNKTKRRAQHTIQTLLPLIQKPFIGVFFVKKGGTTLPYTIFKEEIKSLLQKAKLI